MYDIKKLEEEWETYNKRRKQPLYIATGFLVLFILIIVLWFNKSSKEETSKSMVINEIDRTTSSIESTSVKPPVDVAVSQVVLDITDNNDKELQNEHDEALLSQVAGTTPMKAQTNHISNNKIEKPPYGIVKNEPVLEEVESLSSVKTPTIVKNDQKSSKHALKIDISDILTTNAFQDVEDRFYETKDTDDSLFLARTYLKKGDYNKALYWALQTNKVNDSMREFVLLGEFHT